MPGVTADGSAVLAKNSDRSAGESQPLIQVARASHPAGATLGCQYIEVPQACETLGLIGSRPYWLWGFEHGMNERGVAIGNEAVFTKEELPEIGLLGMDLVRLGLERGRTAREALDAITGLLEEFGQGGSGHEHNNFPYSNSFIIADASEAYVLETSGRQYAWKKVNDVACISNHVAIGAEWDELSDDAASHAVSNGWWDEGSSRLDFAAAYRSTELTPPQVSEERLRQSRMLLEEYRGKVSPQTMMRALRDHYDGGTVFAPGRAPDDGKFFTICMHAEPVGSTTASVVAHLRAADGEAVYWASVGAPCCGVFMPLYMGGEIPKPLTQAGSEFSEDSVWWRFRKLNDLVSADYAGRTPRVQRIWGALEDEFRQRAVDVEAQAGELRSNDKAEQAGSVLAQFMQNNLDTVLGELSGLLTEFEKDG